MSLDRTPSNFNYFQGGQVGLRTYKLEFRELILNQEHFALREASKQFSFTLAFKFSAILNINEKVFLIIKLVSFKFWKVLVYNRLNFDTHKCDFHCLSECCLFCKLINQLLKRHVVCMPWNLCYFANFNILSYSLTVFFFFSRWIVY